MGFLSLLLTRAVIDTPHIDVPTIAVNRWLQSCHLDALIDASRWQKKEKLTYLRPQNCEECCGRWSVPTCVSRHIVYKRNIVVTCSTFLLQCNRKCKVRQATNERTEIHDQSREYPLQRNWPEVWYDEQLRSMVHYSTFATMWLMWLFGMTNNYDQWYITHRS